MSYTHSLGGDSEVKASSLSVGDTIRDPRKRDRVLVVESIGTTIFARGFDKGKTNKHVFLKPDDYVSKVTNAQNENSVIL